MTIASEITDLQDNLTNAKNAVTTKGGTVGDTGLAGLASEIGTIPTGGSTEVVNGIILNFKATSSTIDANTFVEFVNNFTHGTDTQLSTTSNSYEYASAVTLSTDKVFISFRGNGNYLYGIVCTISGDTITTGTETQISTISSSYQYASATALGSDKIFIAHRGNNTRLYGIVCTISGTTITVGGDTELSSTSNTYQYASAATIGTDKVFIAHQYSNYLYGIVCTISGTSISKGADTMLSSRTASYTDAKVTVLDTDKVFVAHDSSGNNGLFGVVCTVSNKAITAGSDTRLTVVQDAATPSAVALSASKVFVAYSSSTDGLHGAILAISGTSFTVSTDRTISLSPSTFISTALTNPNRVLITHNIGEHLYGVVCDIVDGSIIMSAETLISDGYSSYYYASATVLSTGKVFIAHRNSSYLYGIVGTTPGTTIAASANAIQGLTKTECSTSTAGEVWVLDQN